jgi:hypothetical protein
MCTVHVAHGLIAILLAGACGPADDGFSVRVTNRCDSTITFVVDGGEPRQLPRSSNLSLRAGTRETYSVIAGSQQGGFFELRQGSDLGDPIVVFDHPGSGHSAEVLVSGTPCLPQVTDEGNG